MTARTLLHPDSLNRAELPWAGLCWAGLLIFPLTLPAAAGAESLQPGEARILQGIVETEHPSAQVTAAEPVNKAVAVRLKELGLDTAGLKSWTARDKDAPQQFLSATYNPQGHVLALVGNGPWLRNDSIRALKGMPELRVIRIDHNGHLKNHPLASLYSGTGFDALADSKILDIKVTLGFNDAGLEQVARIKGLKALSLTHSQVTEEGLKHLVGHPSLQSFKIAEMGNVSQNALATIAQIPHLTDLGFHEAFVTYEAGFRHLKPLKGRLKSLDLTMTLVNDEDLNKLKTDHPDLAITTLEVSEFPKRHIGVASRLAQIGQGEAAETLKKAVAAYKATNPKSNPPKPRPKG